MTPLIIQFNHTVSFPSLARTPLNQPFWCCHKGLHIETNGFLAFSDGLEVGRESRGREAGSRGVCTRSRREWFMREAFSYCHLNAWLTVFGHPFYSLISIISGCDDGCENGGFFFLSLPSALLVCWGADDFGRRHPGQRRKVKFCFLTWSHAWVLKTLQRQHPRISPL